MSKAFEKLETLSNLQEWHESAVEIFKTWRKELEGIEMDQNYAEMPQTMWLAEKLKATIETVNKELIEVREMSDRRRDYLFALKEISESIYKAFSKEELNNRVESIERDIDQELKIWQSKNQMPE